MKQVLLSLVLLFLVSTTQAQEIYSITWYLISLNEGGTSITIPNNNEVPYVQANFYQGSPDLFETGACNYCGGDVVIDHNTGTMLFNIACTLSECMDPDNSDFDNAYGYFFTENPQDVYTFYFGYIDGPPGPDETLLWIEKPNGDYVLYSDINYNLSTLENELQDLSITPNPVRQEFTVSGIEGIENLHLSLYDVSGKLVLQNENYKDGERLSVNHLKAGIYFVRLGDSAGNISIGKLIKL